MLLRCIRSDVMQAGHRQKDGLAVVIPKVARLLGI